jgi:esterase
MLELYYREYGAGKPLLILHGLFGSSDNWQSLAQRFASFYRVICIDLRNHGRSPWHEEHNYEAMSDDLYAFIKSQGLDDIILLGHSMGGKVAMRFAQAYPHLINKLIVADMGIKAYPMHHQHILAGIHSLHLERLGSRGEAEEILKIHVENDGIRQFLLKNLYWIEKGK